MDIENCLIGNNPPRGKTYVLVCGQNFIDDLEEILKYNKNKDSLT